MYPVSESSQALSAAKALKLQAQNLTSLLNNWDPRKLDEEKCRQLLAVLYGVEKKHLEIKEKCGGVVQDIFRKMESTRLQSLTSNLSEDSIQQGVSTSNSSSLSNPMMFYRQNIAIIEKASLKHKVRSVRVHGATATNKGKTSTDM